MKIVLILGIVFFLAGYFMVFATGFLTRLLSRKSSSDADTKSMVCIAGFWLLLFSLPLIAFPFLNFNPSRFIWMGLISGVILAILSFYRFFFRQATLNDSENSGKGIRGLGEGAMVLALVIGSPFLGLLAGFIEYLMIR